MDVRANLSRLAKDEAVALLAGFLVLVVCGAALADRYIDPSADLLTRTAAAAQREGTYKFLTQQRYSGDVPKDAGGYTAGVQLQGAVDIDAGTTRFETLINLGRIEAKCTYLTADDDLFVSVHPSRRNEVGASWLRTRAEGAIAAANLQGLRPDQLNTRSAELFEGLEPDGTATIRGVRTTRYRGEVDIAALAGGASSQGGAALQLGRTLPVAVYIDDDDLLRRLTIEIRAVGRFSVTYTTDIYDYGDDLRITRPAANTVKQGDAQSVAVACYPKVFPRVPGTPSR